MRLPLHERKRVIELYFGENGAGYTLGRVHMNSCDFSVDHYSYAPVENDTLLKAFTVKPDEDDVIPILNPVREINKIVKKNIFHIYFGGQLLKD